MEKRLEFIQIRDIGEMLSAAFYFMRVRFAGYFKVLAMIGGPAYLLSMVSQSLYQIKILKEASGGGDYDVDNPFSILNQMLGWEFLAAMIFGIISYTLITVAGYAYLRLYIAGNDNPTSGEVWNLASERFGNVLLSMFVVGVALILAFVALILPGIWLAVSLSVFFAVMLLEDETIGGAFTRSIRLVNTSWWNTFGLIVVVVIVLIIFSMAVTLPFTIAGLFLTAVQGGPDGIQWFTILSNTISQLAAFVMNGFMVVLTTLLYYSLREKREGISLVSRVENLGNNAGLEKSEEEY